MQAVTKVWNMVDGPFEDPEIEGVYLINCLTELEDGSIEERDMYFPDLGSCRTIERYFKSSIDPLTVDQMLDLIEEE